MHLFDFVSKKRTNMNSTWRFIACAIFQLGFFAFWQTPTLLRAQTAHAQRTFYPILGYPVKVDFIPTESKLDTGTEAKVQEFLTRYRQALPKAFIGTSLRGWRFAVAVRIQPSGPPKILVLAQYKGEFGRDFGRVGETMATAALDTKSEAARLADLSVKTVKEHKQLKRGQLNQLFPFYILKV
jgi:hypothetical protein